MELNPLNFRVEMVAIHSLGISSKPVSARVNFLDVKPAEFKAAIALIN